MKTFELVSDFTPSGDQPQAISQLVEGLKAGRKHQVLLGVTGSGKTFTVANVLARMQRPALVLSHNKTLAAQLYGEFRQFFPNNAVEYFVSYYDYYQPEAYLPSIDTYIEKDLSINEELEKLRLSVTSALLSGRRDVIVVSSVSCLYGIGNPKDFHENTVHIRRGMRISRNQLLRSLTDSLYSRDDLMFRHGTFRVKGDTVDVRLAYSDSACRMIFWGDEIEEIYTFDPVNNLKEETFDDFMIYPANIFVPTRDRQLTAVQEIRKDMAERVQYFRDHGQNLEAKRLEDRVNSDVEMISELGYCSGIENYSRYFDGREAGERPFCLLDYFPEDFITIIDESHVTVPQIHAMYGGNRSRKVNLIEYGFRLPSAIDNRPLTFDEFSALIGQTIYVSATPADYELTCAEGVVVEQLIRPTGLLDPPIEVKPTEHQIDDLMDQIDACVRRGERVLVTTLTKRMAEELDKYLGRSGVRSRYIHSDVDTLERVEIMEDLRAGSFDVLVGVNLLREGLDLPEVSLVAILDADKEGFLRSARSLTQTAGRVARNLNGRVIMYADTITQSMQQTIDETERRRAVQMEYNRKHGITPQQVNKSRGMMGDLAGESSHTARYADIGPATGAVAEDPVLKSMKAPALEKIIDQPKKAMQKASKDMDFMEAARLRDELYMLQSVLQQLQQKKDTEK